MAMPYEEMPLGSGSAVSFLETSVCVMANPYRSGERIDDFDGLAIRSRGVFGSD